MKRFLPIALLILLIAIIIFAIRMSQGDDEIIIPTETESATSTETTSQTAGQDNWFSCSDRSRIQISYSENADQATLSFHDDVFTLLRVESASGARYVDDAKGLEYWEHQGEITINQKGTDATVTCQVAS